MRKIMIGLGVSAGAMLLGSCSQLNRLVRSGDTEAIYQQALIEYNAGKWRKAATYLEVAYNDLYTSERVDTVLFYMGKVQYNLGEYEIAAEIFDQYRKNFGRRPFSEEAEYLLPMAYYKRSRMVEKDQTETRKAMVAFTEYLNRYPDSERADQIKPLVEQMQAKLYQKAFINASLYEKLREYPASVTALRAALKDNPETPYREQMMFLICRSWYEYAQRSIPARKLDRYMKMVDAYYNFVSEYPESEAYKRSLDRMFAESKAYVDFNQQLTMEVEKDRIDVEAKEQHIEVQKELLRDITDPLERSIAQKTLRADQADLRALKKQLKAEAKVLKRRSSKREIKKEEKSEQ